MDSVTSGTSPTKPSACRSASVNPVDLLMLGSRRTSMPRLPLPVPRFDADFSFAGLQLQHVLSFVKRPNTCECRIKMTYNGLGASLQYSRQTAFGPGRKGSMNIRAQGRLTRAPGL